MSRWDTVKRVINEKAGARSYADFARFTPPGELGKWLAKFEFETQRQSISAKNKWVKNQSRQVQKMLNDYWNADEKAEMDKENRKNRYESVNEDASFSRLVVTTGASEEKSLKDALTKFSKKYGVFNQEKFR